MHIRRGCSAPVQVGHTVASLIVLHKVVASADAGVDIRHYADFGVPEEGIAEECADDFDGVIVHVLGVYDAVLAVFPPKRKDIAFFCSHKGWIDVELLNIYRSHGAFGHLSLRQNIPPMSPMSQAWR